MESLENIYHRGEIISLRAPKESDIDTWYQWMSDEETTMFLADRFWPNTKEEQLKFFHSLSGSKDRLVLMVVSNETGEPVGVCSLSSINWKHRYAHVAALIGNKSHRKGPLAIEVYDCLLRIAFLRLNLNCVMSFSCGKNTQIHNIHKMVGFQVRGHIPNVYDFMGEPDEMLLSSVDRQNWLKEFKK